MLNTRGILSVILLLTLQAAPARSADPATGSDIAALAGRAAGIEIFRDDFGVPHIYAETDADAVFGMLYAQAEDDFPRIERNYSGPSAAWRR